MKRYFTLAVLAILAVSCGGRQGQKQTEEPQTDSVHTTITFTPRVDTTAEYKGPLPEEPFLDIVTNLGTIRVKLYKDTPKHRANFIRLATTHFYDSVLFHRVINGFMIQGGDPFTRDTSRVAEWGEGGPGYNIDAEILPEHKHQKGALAAARRGDMANPMKESSGSQFYLVQDPAHCTHLDGEYTVFGETVSGLVVIDRIARVKTDRYDRPVQPVVIRHIRLNHEQNQKALEEERRAREAALQDNPAESNETAQ